MKNITIIHEKQNKYGFYGKISIKREYLEKISRALLGAGPLSEIKHLNLILEKNEDPAIISISDFSSLATSLAFKGELSIIRKLDLERSDEIYHNYRKASENFVKVVGEIEEKEPFGFSIKNEQICDDILNRCINNDDMTEYENFFSIIIDLIGASKDFYKRRDLLLAKDKIYNNLRYIASSEQLNEYNSTCIKLLSSDNFDLKEAEVFLKSAQNIVLENWRKEVTPIDDFVSGKPFKFICHSTNSSKWTGDFYSKYISASLLTEEFTDTYRSGCGFILSPENIVGADGDDLYAYNGSSNADDILNSSSIPIICPPRQIIELCRDRKEENKINGNKYKIYNEVLIEGFNPQAIFCITNGSKMLNDNYRQAMNLKKYFPTLKIIEIDLTKYKTYSELKEERNRLIKSIEMQIDPEYYKKTDSNYDLFELFWQKYLKMKNTSNYQESNIIDLYRINKKILFGVTTEELFSGIYDDDTIRFCLLKNYNINIEKILNGNIDLFDLSKLKKGLLSYSSNPKLNNIFPGIGTFLEMLNKIEITSNIIESFNNLNPRNFTSMIKIIGDYLLIRKSDLVDQKEGLIQQKILLEQTIKAKEENLNTNQSYQNLIDIEMYYKIATLDQSKSQEDLANISIKKSKLESDKLETEKELQSKKAIENKYVKHRILNYFKIKRIRLEIKILENRIKNNDIDYLEEEKAIENNFLSIIEEFQKKFGISLDEYPNLLKEAKSNIDYSFLSFGVIEIESLKKELLEVSNKIKLLTIKQESLEQNIELINTSKSII